jgi:hypothetical protein
MGSNLKKSGGLTQIVVKLSKKRGMGRIHKGAMMMVKRNLEQCKVRLQGWDRRKYKNTEKEVGEKTKLLSKLQHEDREGNQEKIKQLQMEIEKLLELEDIKWK